MKQSHLATPIAQVCMYSKQQPLVPSINIPKALNFSVNNSDILDNLSQARSNNKEKAKGGINRLEHCNWIGTK